MREEETYLSDNVTGENLSTDPMKTTLGAASELPQGSPLANNGPRESPHSNNESPWKVAAAMLLLGEGKSNNDTAGQMATATSDPQIMALQQQMLALQNTLENISKFVTNSAPEKPLTSKKDKKRTSQIPTEEVRRCSLLKPPRNDITHESNEASSIVDWPDEEDAGLKDDNAARTKRLAKKRDNDLRNWVAGKTRNSKPERIYEDIEQATANNLGEVLQKMEKIGYAIIKDYNALCDDTNTIDPKTYKLFREGNAPTVEQAFFHETPPDIGKAAPPMTTIFEGVVINHGRIDYKPAKPVSVPTGLQPRSVMKFGTPAYNRYQDKYKGQAEDIIKGMFAKHVRKGKKHPAADPKNWIIQQNVVVGGVDHQHPHCDQGKAGSYHNERLFPFVAVHGFGINEFQMWLLPAKQKREYGFLYQFPKNAILFMRGDFIHAGACLQEARGHIMFYPKREAGYDDENPYWASNSFDTWLKNPESFLVTDLRCRPFAYPHFSARTVVGNQTVTYPAKLTEDLIEPLPRRNPVKKRKRKGKEVHAESELDDEDEYSGEESGSEEESQDQKRFQRLKKVRKDTRRRKW